MHKCRYTVEHLQVEFQIHVLIQGAMILADNSTVMEPDQ